VASVDESIPESRDTEIFERANRDGRIVITKDKEDRVVQIFPVIPSRSKTRGDAGYILSRLWHYRE
jgi:hypothetical protein